MKLSERAELVAVVLSENVTTGPMKRFVRRARNRLLDRGSGGPFADVWRHLMERSKREHPFDPSSSVTRVRNVNDDACFAAMQAAQPDLLVVSGTNLVGRRLIGFAAERRGVVNLHTGLSPYVKGGPNCTNWCLAEGWFHLIGSTVMWLDAGIDTGKIITSARAPLTGDESLRELHWAVLEHAHSMYAEVVSRLAAGDDLPAVPQAELGAGRTFYNRQWDADARRRALVNFEHSYGAEAIHGAGARDLLAAVRTVPLP
jgi:methionyl-tRNA formyltransferase